MCISQTTSTLPTLIIFNSHSKVEHFLKHPPLLGTPLGSFAFLISALPLEKAISCVDPYGFSKVIAYYPKEKNAHAILSESFLSANILVYELAKGHAWPPIKN